MVHNGGAALSFFLGQGVAFARTVAETLRATAQATARATSTAIVPAAPRWANAD